MEQDEPAFKPQWLTGTVRTAGAASLWGAPSPRTDYQAKGSSSRNPSSVHDRHHSSRQSSSRKSSGSNGSRRPERDGMGKSKGYANFGRNRERDREKKDFDSGDSESRPVAGDRHVFKSFGTCRPERDRLNRARSKPDPWSNKLDSLNNGSTSRSSANVSSSSSSDVVSLSENNAIVSTPRSNTAVSISVSNAAVSNTAISTSRSNAVGIAFEREFPQLSSEDKHGRQGFKVRSPGISTPLQNVPLINASDGWNSVLADIPLLNDRKKSPASSLVLQSVPSKQTESVPNSGTALSMAETVMQAPLRISIGPQLSIEAQKIEERTLRQYTLRPLTPPASKSSISS